MANYYHNQPGPQEQSSYPSTPPVPPTAVGNTTTTQHVPCLSSYPLPPPYFCPPSDIPPLQPYPGTLISQGRNWGGRGDNCPPTFFTSWYAINHDKYLYCVKCLWKIKLASNGNAIIIQKGDNLHLDTHQIWKKVVLSSLCIEVSGIIITGA